MDRIENNITIHGQLERCICTHDCIHTLCLLYRVADTGILLVQSQVIPAHTTGGLRVLADWIAKTWQVKLHTCSCAWMAPHIHDGCVPICSSEHLSPDSSVNIEELFHKVSLLMYIQMIQWGLKNLELMFLYSDTEYTKNEVRLCVQV